METIELMETMDIATEEVDEAVETTDEYETETSGDNLKIAVGMGLAALAGVAVCKFVIDPIAAKIKRAKEEKALAKLCSRLRDTDEAVECDKDESGSNSEDQE